MRALLALLYLSVLLAPSAQTQTLYAGSTGLLHEVDFATGAITPLFGLPFSLNGMSDSGQPNMVYGCGFNTDLYRIDITAQVTTLVGSCPVCGLAWDDSTGTLWGNDYIDLYRIDTATGAVTLIGAHSTSFGNFWALDYDALRGRLVAWSFDSPGLYEIDRASGAASLIGASTVARITDIWCDPVSGRYFACHNFPNELYEIDPVSGQATLLASINESLTGLANPSGLIGSTYCSPSMPNSTGAPAALEVLGSQLVAANDVELLARSLPLNAFAYFLTAQGQGSVPNAGGSQGTFCLAGSIGRYVGPGQIQSTGTQGVARLPLDLTQHPTPVGLVSVQAGQTWNFQCWYRDANPTVTSNFSDAVSVTFL